MQLFRCPTSTKAFTGGVVDETEADMDTSFLSNQEDYTTE